MTLTNDTNRTLNSISFVNNKMIDHIVMLDKKYVNIYQTGKENLVFIWIAPLDISYTSNTFKTSS